jgi:hypothetical protein
MEVCDTKRNLEEYCMDYILQPQDRIDRRILVNTVMNIHVALKAGNLLTSWATAGFSRITWSYLIFH